jgi:hypothetical protein
VRFKATHIAQGKKIVRNMNDTKWEMGDLLLEVFPLEEWGRCHVGVKNIRRQPHVEKFLAALREFADRIKYDGDIFTLVTYRYVSISWPLEKRVNASWTAHRVLSSHDRRFTVLKPGMRVMEARILAGHRTARRGRPTYSVDSYVDAIKYLQASGSFMKSAATRLGDIGLTNKQLLEIEALVGRVADGIDLVIAAADLQVEEAA